MDNSEVKLLLEIIDKRIRKILAESHICYRYIGKVTGDSGTTYSPNSNTPVLLMGFDSSSSSYSFMNRTRGQLSVGDLVYIDAIGDNLNSGVITQVYKYKSQLFIE